MNNTNVSGPPANPLIVEVRGAKIKISSEVIEAFLSQVDNEVSEDLRIWKVRKSEHSIEFIVYDLLTFVHENATLIVGLVNNYTNYLLYGEPSSSDIVERIQRTARRLRFQDELTYNQKITKLITTLIPIRRIALGITRGNIRSSIIIGKEISLAKIPEEVQKELRQEGEKEWVKSIKGRER